MELKNLIKIFQYANRMKTLPRMGWLFRNIKNPESLADHSYNVVFITFILAEYFVKHKNIDINTEKALKIAILHDLSESIITDIPTPFIKYFGNDIKSNAELLAMNDIFKDFISKDEIISLWEEFEKRSTIEGILVRGADKLDMMLQIISYEELGHKGLDAFWDNADKLEELNHPLIKEIFKEITKLRHNKTEDI